MNKMTFTTMCMAVLLSLSGVIYADQSTQFVSTYCITCHGSDTQKADRRFDDLGDAITDLQQLELWQEIVDQLNLGEMPPPNKKQPRCGREGGVHRVGHGGDRFRACQTGVWWSTHRHAAAQPVRVSTDDW